MPQKASEVVGVLMINDATANGTEGKALIVAEVIIPNVDPPPCFDISRHLYGIAPTTRKTYSSHSPKQILVLALIGG